MDVFYLHPLDVVFGFLLDEVHPLQHVGDVVETSFLDVEGLGRLVQIHHAVRRLAQQLHKLLSQETQRRVVASLLRRRLWSYEEV